MARLALRRTLTNLTIGTLGVALGGGLGCNSRRFVSAEKEVGNAWDDSRGSASEVTSGEGTLVQPAPTSASPGDVVVPTGERVETPNHASTPEASATSGPAGETNSADVGMGANTRDDSLGAHVDSRGGDGSSAPVASNGTDQTSSLQSLTEPATSDEAVLTPASAAERDARIAALAPCAPNAMVSAPSQVAFDFEGLTLAQFASGVLTFGDDAALEAVLAYYDDSTGDYSLALTEGSEQTPGAVQAANPGASEWGGGVAIVLPCFDASRFEGVEFWIRGETPAGTIAFGIGTRNDASATTELAIPAVRTHFRVPFSDLAVAAASGAGFGGFAPVGGPGGFAGPGPAPGPGNFFDGSAVRALVWSAQLRYAEQPPRSNNWEAETGAFQIAVDGVRFY